MTEQHYDVEATLKELKRSSQSSLTMVLLGAAALVFSLIYSATRLAPLENDIAEKIKEIAELEKSVAPLEKEIAEKSSEIELLAKTEAEFKNKIAIAKESYSRLKSNIEKLYAVRVTDKNLVFELKAAAKATGKVTGSGSEYNFSIFVNAPSDTLEKIKKVTYTFGHPTFQNKVRSSERIATKFMTDYYGWGCLTNVTADFILADGSTHRMDFNMCKSLGPQWW